MRKSNKSIIAMALMVLVFWLTGFHVRAAEIEQTDLSETEQTKIELDKAEVTLAKGLTLQLVWKLIPENGADTISITTENPEIATVDQTGMITAIKEGVTSIVFTLSNGEKAVCKVYVATPIQAIMIPYISDEIFTLAVDQTRTLHYQITPKNVTNQKLVWSSSDENVAVVDENGTVTAIGTGRAQITLEVLDGSGMQVITTAVINKRKSGSKSSEQGLSIIDSTKSKYSYQEMKRDLKDLENIYGDCITVHVLDQTYDNRNIYEVVLGNPNAKKHIVIQAAMHGREYVTSLLTMKQIEFYCKNFYSGIYQDKYYSEVFDDVALHIVPMLNPDGVSISQYGSKGIKDKKLKKGIEKICKKYGRGRKSYYTIWKSNARGVDLNRNFNVNWSILKNKSKKASGYFYKGKNPESEVETKALIRLMNEVKPVCTLNYHASGSVLYWDFGQKDKLKKESKKLTGLVKKLTGYQLMPKFSKKESAGFGDWVSIKKKLPTVTIEVGSGSCPLSKKKFKQIWKKNKMVYIAVADLYHD